MPAETAAAVISPHPATKKDDVVTTSVVISARLHAELVQRRLADYPGAPSGGRRGPKSTTPTLAAYAGEKLLVGFSHIQAGMEASGGIKEGEASRTQMIAVDRVNWAEITHFTTLHNITIRDLANVAIAVGLDMTKV